MEMKAQEETIMENFYKKLFVKVKNTFPRIFETEEKILEADQIDKFIKELEHNHVIFERIKNLMRLHNELHS
jgi:hypothetical protein